METDFYMDKYGILWVCMETKDLYGDVWKLWICKDF